MDIINQFLATIGIGSLSVLLKALVTLVICMIAMNVIKSIVERLLQKATFDDAIKTLIRTALGVALWALTVIIVADSLGISTASLVAVISIAGLALSLSVQDIMSNLFSGIVILLNKTFKKGDYVDIGANSGVINKVGLFHTIINTLDNKLVSIPNKDVAGASVVNYSAEPLRRVDIIVGADYNDHIDDVKAALLEAASMDPKILQDPAPFAGLLNYKDSTIEYTVRVWCKGPDYWDVYFKLNENIFKCYEKHGVHMSFNHVNVHMIQ